MAARIGRAAEADLVPRPRVAVERGEDVAVDDLPGEGLVHRVPRLAAQARLRKAIDELLLLLQRLAREAGTVEACCDRAPQLVVVGQDEVAIAVARPLRQLLVDEV